MSGVLPSGGGDGGGGDSVDLLGSGDDGSGGSGAGMNSLQMLRGGTSALSALSTFGQASNSAAQMRQAAYTERLSASDEYTQANQTANNLMRQYQRVTGAQQSTAAAEGVDIGSGSVQAQQQYAQGQMDRQVQVVRGTANMNAQLRLARAAALTSAANSTGILGALGAAVKIGTTAAQLFAGG